jgi:hypothetical protein
VKFILSVLILFFVFFYFHCDGTKAYQNKFPIEISISEDIAQNQSLVLLIQRSLNKYNKLFGYTVFELIVSSDIQTLPRDGHFKDGLNSIYIIKDASKKYLAVTSTMYHFLFLNIQESDITFNFVYDYFFEESTESCWNKFDFETVLTHELGHLLGLDHTSSIVSPESIMNPYIDTCEFKRDFSEIDVLLLNDKYHFRSNESK